MSRLVAQFEQSAREAVSRTLNWADDLNSSTISSVAWTVPSDLTTDSTSNTTQTSTIKLSGGTPGQVYTVRCLVTLANAEKSEAEFTVTITS